MELLGPRLRAARKAAGLTQYELAERTGMNQGHISRLETDGRGASLEHLRQLAREVGVTVAYLIGDEVQAVPSIRESGSSREAVATDASAPPGLRELAKDDGLVQALGIHDEEWRCLRSIELPTPTSKDGYVQLLMTVRAITASA